MLVVYGNNERLYQWDIGRKLIVTDPNCYIVHFAENTTDVAAVLEVYEYEGQRVVDIPNFLLQKAGSFVAFTVVVDEDALMTTSDQWFNVIARNQPADYLYTEPEVVSYGKLARDIAVMRESLPTYGSTSAGQFLQVTATDENGQPTEVSSVNLVSENLEFGFDDGTTVVKEVYVKS
jgi:hypothetical protein